jgi:broad specificity phosphatase PhoE
MPDIWLVRHAETEWSASGRHTSVTNISLTDEGRSAAAALAPLLAAEQFTRVLSSPLQRSLETARLAGFPHPEIDPDLCEWDYGELEGVTTPQIRSRGPEWSAWTVWRGPLPGGETLDEVAARARRVLDGLHRASGAVLLFSHGHFSRVLTAVALDLDPACGAHFALDPATVNIIGHEHEVRALTKWNITPCRRDE